MHQSVNIEVSVGEYKRVLERVAELQNEIALLKTENKCLEVGKPGLLREADDMFNWLCFMQASLADLCIKMLKHNLAVKKKIGKTAVVMRMQDELLDVYNQLKV